MAIDNLDDLSYSIERFDSSHPDFAVQKKVFNSMALFNKYGVLPMDSGTSQLMDEFHDKFKQHLNVLLKDGASIVEIRAIESLMASTIGGATSEVIILHALKMRREEKFTHEQFREFAKNNGIEGAI